MTSEILKVFRDIGKEAVPLIKNLKDGKEVVGENPIGQNSLKADVALEDLVIERLRESGLGGTLETEEKGRVELGEGPYRFVCDPLDGSGNYFRDVPFYGMVLGAAEGDRFNDLCCSYIICLTSGDEWWATDEGAFLNGKKISSSDITDLSKCICEFDPVPGPQVYDRILPVLKKSKDARRYGANAIAYCLLAQGGLHVFLNIESEISAIHTPGLHIAKNAGCVITTDDGGDFNPKLEVEKGMSFVASANKELHKKVLKLIG
ncbi:MAG: inositol monophosphatase family protein [Candidatus Altiarchaeota archaeon]